MVNAEESSRTDAGVTIEQNHELNGNTNPLLYPTPKLENHVYKLIIQIDKIKPRPCPKSKKPSYLLKMRQQKEANMRQRILSASPIVSSKKEVACLICNETFQSAQSLFLHKKKYHRFVCQICDAYCSTQVLCARHEKLHVSDDPNLPHKCHLCSQKFDTKRNVRLHTRIMHTFVSRMERLSPHREKALRLKTSHVRKFVQPAEKIGDDFREKYTWRNESKDYENFTCHVCYKDFSTIEAAEEHAAEHMEYSEKEYSCNICKKVFKNDIALNAHLTQHLSRALRCPMCPKAFINQTTLRVHMKSHNRDK